TSQVCRNVHPSLSKMAGFLHSSGAKHECASRWPSARGRPYAGAPTQTVSTTAHTCRPRTASSTPKFSLSSHKEKIRARPGLGKAPRKIMASPTNDPLHVLDQHPNL